MSRKDEEVAKEVIKIQKRLDKIVAKNEVSFKDMKCVALVTCRAGTLVIRRFLFIGTTPGHRPFKGASSYTNHA